MRRKTEQGMMDPELGCVTGFLLAALLLLLVLLIFVGPDQAEDQTEATELVSHMNLYSDAKQLKVDMTKPEVLDIINHNAEKVVSTTTNTNVEIYEWYESISSAKDDNLFVATLMLRCHFSQGKLTKSELYAYGSSDIQNYERLIDEK